MFNILMALCITITPNIPTDVCMELPNGVREVKVDEGNMYLNEACAQVVEDSGYTSFYDLSEYVFPTQEYVDACF